MKHTERVGDGRAQVQGATDGGQAPPAAPDGTPLSRFIVAHGGFVEATLRRLGAPDADLPDLRQEVWIVVLRRAQDFEGRGSVRSFLYGICRRVLSDHRRRAYRHRERPADEGTLPDPAPSADAQVAARATLAEAARALSAMPADRRQLLLRVGLDELPMRTLAARTGRSHKTLYSQLYAARAALRRALRRAGHALLLPLGGKSGHPSPAGGVAGQAALALPTLALALTLSALSLAPGRAPQLAASDPGLTPTPRYVAFAMSAATAPPPPPSPANAIVGNGGTAAAAVTARGVAGSQPVVTEMRFSVRDVLGPRARLRLRQVAFMDFVPVH